MARLPKLCCYCAERGVLPRDDGPVICRECRDELAGERPVELPWR